MLGFVETILQRDCYLDPGRAVLVGVSGGPDSLCLLDVLFRLGYPLVVAHLNHSLRPEADSDARELEKYVREIGLPISIRKVDVAAYARVHSLSIEEAARNVRYSFLFELARQVGAQAVAVAHTADDQVETVLMHLLRGAGLAGLRGMSCWSMPTPWSSETPLIRPLLKIWRHEVEAYLGERELTPHLDQTNLDTRIYRNRLRHELIPYLENYNPGVRQAILRMSQVLAGDYDVIEGIVDAAWEECLAEQGEGHIAFRYSALVIQPEGIRRHLLRKAISQLLPGLRDINYNAIERAVEFLGSLSRSGLLDLVAGLYLLHEEDRLWVASWGADLPVSAWPQIPGAENGCDEIELPVPGTVFLKNGWVLEAKIDENSDPSRDPGRQHMQVNRDPFQAWLDAEKVSYPLRVRCRWPGDRFKPLGMEGHSMKLSDFMINARVPARARANWPLVFSGDELAWVAGVRPAHPFSLMRAFRKTIHLRLSRAEESK